LPVFSTKCTTNEGVASSLY